MSKKGLLLVVVTSVNLMSGCARCEDDSGWIQFDEGWWRLELSGVPEASGDPVDRDGDYYLMGSAEYEFKAFHRSTFGLRLMPLFYYYEDDGGGAGSIFGAGGGVRYRMYWDAETRSGLYLELGVSAFGHTEKFEGNSTHLNFLSEGGIGYQFRNTPWNLGVRYTHISNAALGSENKEIQGFALALGYRF